MGMVNARILSLGMEHQTAILHVVVVAEDRRPLTHRPNGNTIRHSRSRAGRRHLYFFEVIAVLSPSQPISPPKRLAAVENQSRFVETVSNWLVSLPHDLKILYEASSDENLERTARELAVGAIIYVVSPNDFISADRHDSFLSFTDDCLLLRMAMQRVVAESNEDTDFFKSRFPEFFDSLEEGLNICEQAMGELYAWLASKVEGLKGLEYRGKKVAKYIDDDEASEFLYEEGLAFRTEYPVDEEQLSDRLKKASTILDAMRRWKEKEDIGSR